MSLSIDENGDLGYLPADTTGHGDEYVADGIVSAVCGFFPIVVDYDDYNYPTNIPGTFDTENWIRAQRQVIGQYANGDYAILTCEGRNFNNSTGLTISELQTLCKDFGMKFAFNLDGGGSTQTVIDYKNINSIYEGTSGRKRSLYIVFNGSNEYSIPIT